jgi:hypothetical protein
VDECAKEPEDSGFRKLSAIYNLVERKLFAEMMKSLKDVTGTQHSERLITIAPSRRGNWRRGSSGRQGCAAGFLCCVHVGMLQGFRESMERIVYSALWNEQE